MGTRRSKAAAKGRTKLGLALEASAKEILAHVKGLSPDALPVIMGMLRSQFGSTSEEHLETVRSLAMEAIPDIAKPPT